MNAILTTGGLARATDYSVENIRTLEKSGVIHAQRDSNGRRLFTHKDIAIVQAHKRDARPGRAIGAANNP